MAEKFTGQRCQDCQGGLIYNKQEKYWECPYCGKIYERELRFDKVQIDGLAGINDLVRSTLSKLISLDFKGAEADLRECEKINHASVSTLIAKIAVPIFQSFYSKDRQQEYGRANPHMQKLARDFAEIEDAEEILYDFIDSADIYGLLYIVYSMINQPMRKAKMFELLECREVFSPSVCKYIVPCLLKDQHVEEADVLIGNMAKENSRYVLSVVLSSYPGNDRKAAHVDRLLSKIDSEADLSKVFDTYFSSNTDDSSVIVDTFLYAIARKINFNTITVINSVLQNCTDVESATKVFDALGKMRLDGETAQEVLNWCIDSCDSQEISEIGFKSLFGSNSVFEITDQEVIRAFESEQADELKGQKIIQMLSIFKISNRSLDKLMAYHLMQNSGDFEYRKSVYDDLASRVVSVPLSVAEEYALNVTLDGDNKYIILKDIFSKSKTLSLGASIFSQYLKTAIDTPSARDMVIQTFLEMKLVPDPDAVTAYLLNGKELHSEKVLDMMIALSCKASSNAFDLYLCGMADGTKFNVKIAQILTQYGFTLSSKGYTRYLFEVQEMGSRKVVTAQKYYQACKGDLKALEMRAKVAGVEVNCNMSQCYLFVSRDEPFVMQEILKFLQKEKIKLDEPLEVIGGKKIKMKKFLDAYSSGIDKKVETVAQELL